MQQDLERPTTAFDLRKLLARFPHMSIVTEGADAEILAFFDQAGMTGKTFSLLMQRKPRYFDLFRMRGGESRVIGAREDDGKLVGIGAMTSTPCWIGGRPGHFVYLADLRIKTGNRAIRNEWRDVFGAMIADAPKTAEAGENARIACVIIEGNEKARRVLENKDYNGHRLHRLASYSMITLLGRMPWRRRARSDAFRVERGAALAELETFLADAHREQAFGQAFGAPHFELRRRLATWPEFALADFRIVRDRAGRIVAATAPWNPNSCKQSVVKGPWWTCMWNFAAKTLGWPQFGKPLEVLYCTHLTFAPSLSASERREAFALLVDDVWPEKRRRRAHGLAFCQFAEYELASGLRGYVKVPVPVGMYTAVPSGAEFDASALGRFPPAFELALV